MVKQFGILQGAHQVAFQEVRRCVRVSPMNRTVRDLAQQIGAHTKGDESFTPEILTALEDADAHALCPFFRKGALNSAPALPGAVLADAALADAALYRGVRAAVVHENPVIGLAALIDIFFPEPPVTGGIHPSAAVHPSAEVHPTASIGPNAVVEALARIGENAVVGPGAIICTGAFIGSRARIGPGAVIGHEGFGFAPTSRGLQKIRQVGRVIIEDDVEIGANACVDRGTLGVTRIGRGAKLDNLVQVGHNAQVGQYAVLAGQAGVAGSTVIEDNAMLGGQAGVADHLTVGKGAKVAAKSGVIANVSPGAVVAGYPAVPRVRWLRFFASDAPKKGAFKAALRRPQKDNE